LKKAIRAEIRRTAVSSEVYAATVENVNPRVEDNTGLVKVLLKLTERSNVCPGMPLQATMRLPYDRHIIVPKEALLVRSGKFVVFTAKNKLAQWNYVAVGKENGKEIEILEGLHQGDSVIVTNNLQLAHDAIVSIVKN
jgi:multidrug efflux pump subunit AcrA (membrane-fusion protein)